MDFDPRSFLISLFEEAINAARADACLHDRLPLPPKGKTVVVGAGKAAAAMASYVEKGWAGALSGLVVTPYDHGIPTERIEVVEAAHPIPDAAGSQAAQRILNEVQGLTADDMVLCLISGGGSSLLALPAPDVTLADKQAVNKALLRSGATIHEMNCVRKHLSAIKGGRLAVAAAPARVVTLAISDVPGDDLSVIASGPTVADPTTSADARRIVERCGFEVPDAVRMWLESADSETVKPGDPRLAGAEAQIVMTARHALAAAAERVREAGMNPLILGDTIEGEARDVANVHAAITRKIADHGGPASPPAVILSGGETTVTLRSKGGSGGRNQEFLLALAVALDGHPNIHALACDTDGIDGFSKAAGAVMAPDTLRRAREAGLSPADMLARQDSGGFFSTLRDCVVTGPTRTNVNDFRAIVITHPGTGSDAWKWG
ncbi:MAG: glycerate kinase [Rhodospirillales bacterium]|nr:glycerate kinase [Rhodospirillales bacterium]